MCNSSLPIFGTVPPRERERERRELVKSGGELGAFIGDGARRGTGQRELTSF
jgi:hypothetical protein